jgi:hypothetical protein
LQRLAPDGLCRHARLSPRGEAAGLNRERALAALNGRLLREFSRRTTLRLRSALPARLALPALESFLAENVEKEVRKDARMIRCAAIAAEAGAPPLAEAVRQLLASARETDREFLARVSRFPVRIDIPYQRLEPLRQRRTELGLDLAYRMLQAWRQGKKARSVLDRGELALRVRELLELYARETLALSESVSLPGPLAVLRERMAARLGEEMSAVARSMTAKLGQP